MAGEERSLEPGLSTEAVLLRHIAATPVGARVVARSLLERVEGRRSKLEEKRNRIIGGEGAR